MALGRHLAGCKYSQGCYLVEPGKSPSLSNSAGDVTFPLMGRWDLEPARTMHLPLAVAFLWLTPRHCTHPPTHPYPSFRSQFELFFPSKANPDYQGQLRSPGTCSPSSRSPPSPQPLGYSATGVTVGFMSVSLRRV